MQIRKLFTAVDETMSEMGREANEPLRKVAVVAVVKNPLAGQGYVEDLSELIDASTGLEAAPGHKDPDRLRAFFRHLPADGATARSTVR